MEFQKTLVVSTAHIPRTTSDLLKDCRHNPGVTHCLIIYDKDNYGWFISISEEFQLEEDQGEYSELKTEHFELFNLLKVAFQNKCQWLCLDCDGPVEEFWPTFDW